MIAQTVAWRPDSDRDLADARSWIGDALADWQTRWFDRAAFVVDDVVRIPRDAPWPDHDGFACRSHGDGIRFDASKDADRLLVEAAYGIDERTFGMPGCHASLKSIAADMLDELVGIIRSGPGSPSHEVAALPVDDLRESRNPPNRYGAIALSITSTNGTPVAKIICDMTCIWARADAARTPNAMQALDEACVSRRAALDQSPVTLSVLLGQCRLSAAELATIAVGDVIALDQALDAPITLSIDGTATQVGTGTLGHTGASLSFQLTSLSMPLAS